MHNLRYYKILFPLIQAIFNGNMFGYVVIYILNYHNICVCIYVCIFTLLFVYFYYKLMLNYG